MKICTIDDCNYTVIARGWCSKHYNRWRSHGDPNFVLFQRSDNGAGDAWIVEHLTYTDRDCLTWPFATDHKGYARTTKGFAFRIMCEAVNGPPPTPKHQASHSCGNGHLAYISPVHLKWATVKENHADKLLHGTQIRGEKNYNARLTRDQVREIRSLRGTISISKMAKKFGVSFGCISGIYYGASWKWLP